MHFFFKYTWKIPQDWSHSGHQNELWLILEVEIISSIFSEPQDYDISHQLKKSLKNINMWILKKLLLNNQWIIEEIKEEIKKYLETNDNDSITIQNLWDRAKAVLKGKFIAIQSYMRQQEKSLINNLTLP